MVLRVGITGGIGSGKSTVARIFALLGVPVYYADEAARRLMNEDEELREKIIARFGARTYANGQPDRAYIASLVFNDRQKLDQLNELVHPITIRDAELWMQRQQYPYAVKEAALIFESDAASGLDFIIGVWAPHALRLHRSMKRDNISREQVQQRMNRQITETIKMRLCDFVINNDDQHLVIPQVLDLHQFFLDTARQHHENKNSSYPR